MPKRVRPGQGCLSRWPGEGGVTGAERRRAGAAGEQVHEVTETKSVTNRPVFAEYGRKACEGSDWGRSDLTPVLARSH